MSNLGKAVQSGDSLYDAFAAHPESFDAISCVLLAGAESSDELEISLDTLANYHEKIAQFLQARR